MGFIIVTLLARLFVCLWTLGRLLDWWTSRGSGGHMPYGHVWAVFGHHCLIRYMCLILVFILSSYLTNMHAQWFGNHTCFSKSFKLLQKRQKVPVLPTGPPFFPYLVGHNHWRFANLEFSEPTGHENLVLEILLGGSSQLGEWLVTPIFYPFRPFGRGPTTPLRGLNNYGY